MWSVVWIEDSFGFFCSLLDVNVVLEKGGCSKQSNAGLGRWQAKSRIWSKNWFGWSWCAGLADNLFEINMALNRHNRKTERKSTKWNSESRPLRYFKEYSPKELLQIPFLWLLRWFELSFPFSRKKLCQY
jgi:hypothetical protein